MNMRNDAAKDAMKMMCATEGLMLIYPICGFSRKNTPTGTPISNGMQMMNQKMNVLNLTMRVLQFEFCDQ